MDGIRNAGVSAKKKIKNKEMLLRPPLGEVFFFPRFYQLKVSVVIMPLVEKTSPCFVISNVSGSSMQCSLLE